MVQERGGGEGEVWEDAVEGSPLRRPGGKGGVGDGIL